MMLGALHAKIALMKNPHAVALGRLGGLKGGAAGGHARAASLSSRRRRQIARAAARARWSRQLPEALRPLFPGYKLEKLRLPEDFDLIVLHVLTRGGPEHTRWLVKRFGNETIRRWIMRHRGRGLTLRQMAPWVSERTARRWQQQNPYALLWENR